MIVWYLQLPVGLTVLASWAWEHQTPLQCLSSRTAELLESKQRKKKTFSIENLKAHLLVADGNFFFFKYSRNKMFCLLLCESSLRGCLLGGELFWSLSGYNLLRDFLVTQNRTDKHVSLKQPIYVSTNWWTNWWTAVYAASANLRLPFIVHRSSLERQTETEKRVEIWLETTQLIKALLNVPLHTTDCLCATPSKKGMLSLL